MSCSWESSVVQPGKRSSCHILPRLEEEPRPQAAQLTPSNYQQLLGECGANARGAQNLLFLAGFISEAEPTTFIVLDDIPAACSQLALLDTDSRRHLYPKQTALWLSPGSAPAEARLPTHGGDVGPGRGVCGGRTSCSTQLPSSSPAAAAWTELEG